MPTPGIHASFIGLSGSVYVDEGINTYGASTVPFLLVWRGEGSRQEQNQHSRPDMFFLPTFGWRGA